MKGEGSGRSKADSRKEEDVLVDVPLAIFAVLYGVLCQLYCSSIGVAGEGGAVVAAAGTGLSAYW